jgi:hypothetical protein
MGVEVAGFNPAACPSWIPSQTRTLTSASYGVGIALAVTVLVLAGVIAIITRSANATFVTARNGGGNERV